MRAVVIPWSEAAHFPVRHHLIQTSLLLHIQLVALGLFVVPLVDHGGVVARKLSADKVAQ
jgi:hypothetical protein